ncbi:ATP-grasp fold domain protein, DUF201-type [Desulfofundulus kuznetsovii DSM 6115]|uniref:ATP-grasp fold domain protein, DUF201-type n=1 Tax=Desulfofundulus kuznetsovii (strain DSM 6115 / VKM B-1805 / 17) TaxID=760568 RepID=A0AAU8PD12_DESK7|nr:ATP-grasp fold domain protein, DUF201-type [Desulfofundulus kuznetsovii DSM 6115]
MNILLTSIGRRVAIIDFFKEALSGQGLVMTTDADPTAPGLYRADKGFIVPRVTEKGYIDTLLEICRVHTIGVIIPFIDPELPVLARAKERFQDFNIQVLISSAAVIDICRDKLRTAQFFNSHGIPSPSTFTTTDNLSDIAFPVVLKPRFGSSSLGIVECRNLNELEFYSKLRDDFILQEKVGGIEVTTDVLCDFEGRILSMVPRKRLKVRSGEVERAVTIGLEVIRPWVEKVFTVLKAIGPLNIQCFITDDGPKFTEINPRFGGGYPLAHKAGADFPRKIINLIQGKTVEAEIGKYEKGLVMMRYDDAIFLREDQLYHGKGYYF